MVGCSWPLANPLSRCRNRANQPYALLHTVQLRGPVRAAAALFAGRLHDPQCAEPLAKVALVDRPAFDRLASRLQLGQREAVRQQLPRHVLDIELFPQPVQCVPEYPAVVERELGNSSR